MKASDVLTVLQERLPNITELFCDGQFVREVKPSDQHFVFKVDDTTALHLKQNVLVAGVINKNPVTDVTVIGDIATISTQYDHGYNFDVNYIEKVDIRSEDGKQYYLTLLGVNSPTQLKVQVKEAFDLNLFLVLDKPYNGFFSIDKILDDQHFAVIAKPNFFGPYDTLCEFAYMFTAVRVVSVPDIERFNSLYTAQKSVDDLWIAIVAPDNRASRDRGVTSDSIIAYMDPSAHSGPMEVRQIHVETLTVYCAIPARFEMDGHKAVDVAEEVRFILYRALCGVDIPSEASSSERYPLMPVRDGYFSYLTDNTTYIHEYVFERSIVLTHNDIGLPLDESVPYRGLDLTVFPCIED